jgi:hypothetical protein
MKMRHLEQCSGIAYMSEEQLTEVLKISTLTMLQTLIHLLTHLSDLIKITKNVFNLPLCKDSPFCVYEFLQRVQVNLQNISVTMAHILG